MAGTRMPFAFINPVFLKKKFQAQVQLNTCPRLVYIVLVIAGPYCLVE